MYVELRKYGTTLLSRPSGKESFAAFKPNLHELKEHEQIEVDFSGVITFSPSWGDEFLSPLVKEYGDRLVLKNTQNPSVATTLKLLEEINKQAFRIEN